MADDNAIEAIEMFRNLMMAIKDVSDSDLENRLAKVAAELANEGTEVRSKLYEMMSSDEFECAIADAIADAVRAWADRVKVTRPALVVDNGPVH